MDPTESDIILKYFIKLKTLKYFLYDVRIYLLKPKQNNVKLRNKKSGAKIQNLIHWHQSGLSTIQPCLEESHFGHTGYAYTISKIRNSNSVHQ